MPALPTGTVTFLLSDVVSSTSLWEQHRAQMPRVLARHDELARAHVEACNGHILKPRGEGDSLFCVFARAADALRAAFDWQIALLAEPWPDDIAPRVRLALHTGEAECVGDDYRGIAPNRCARLRSLAGGGQILLSEATCSLMRGESLPPGASLRDWGRHTLRGLSQPEHIFQLLHSDLPDDAVPLLSRPHNLPLALTSLIGRQKDTRQIGERLSEARMVTLTGPGGVGKTRLAVRVAEDILVRFPDGAWLVELAALSDAAILPQEVSRVLGVAETPGLDAAAALHAALQSRQMLLVLDNCEHLLDAAARFADALLRACPHVRILATSREALRVDGERVWPVPPLPLPPNQLPHGDALTELLAETASTRLFVERASAVLPTFALTTGNAAAVARICRQLDGLPHTLELAAAYVDVLTPAQIATRLSDQFHLLTRGSRTALPHHQTLRAAIDWSYDLLSDADRQLLARLSTFAGGWTLEAAEAVGAGGEIQKMDVLDLLSRLVSKSLVQTEETDGQNRYRFYESVRQYAQEKLKQSSDGNQTSRQHRDFYLEMAETADPQMLGPAQGKWLNTLEIEHDNLRAALDGPEEPEKRLRLASALYRFWLVRGYLNEGRARLEDVLLSGGDAPMPLRARAFNRVGTLAWAQKDYPAAQTFFERSLTLHEELGDALGIAHALNNLGMLANEHGDQSKATQYYEKSLNLYRQLNDDASAAGTLGNLGFAAMMQGDNDRARQLYKESLVIRRRLQDNLAVATVLNNLAEIAFRQGDYDAAAAQWEESLEIRHARGDRIGLAYSLSGLAFVAGARGDHARAARLSGASQAVRMHVGAPHSPQEQTNYQERSAPIFAALGETAWNTIRSQGEAMTEIEAVEYALGGTL